MSHNKRNKLTFINDSIYSYEYRFGNHMKYSEGRYEILNKKLIILNSLFQYINDSLVAKAEFSEEINNNTDSIYIVINNQIPEHDLFKYSITINNEEYSTSLRKACKISLNEKTKKIQLKIIKDSTIKTNIFPLRYEAYSNVYQIKNDSANLFFANWNIRGNIFNYEVIKDTLEIKGRKLIWNKKEVILKP